MANNVNNGITGVIDIPGALRSRGAADGNLVGGVVAYAGDIYDTLFSDGVNTGMSQAAINEYLKTNSGTTYTHPASHPASMITYNASTEYESGNVGYEIKQLVTSLSAKYVKPGTGIPKADLTNDVLTSLGYADDYYSNKSSFVTSTALETALAGLSPYSASTGISITTVSNGKLIAVDTAVYKVKDVLNASGASLASSGIATIPITQINKSDNTLLSPVSGVVTLPAIPKNASDIGYDDSVTHLGTEANPITNVQAALNAAVSGFASNQSILMIKVVEYNGNPLNNIECTIEYTLNGESESFTETTNSNGYLYATLPYGAVYTVNYPTRTNRQTPASSTGIADSIHVNIFAVYSFSSDYEILNLQILLRGASTTLYPLTNATVSVDFLAADDTVTVSNARVCTIGVNGRISSCVDNNGVTHNQCTIPRNQKYKIKLSEWTDFDKTDDLTYTAEYEVRDVLMYYVYKLSGQYLVIEDYVEGVDQDTYTEYKIINFDPVENKITIVDDEDVQWDVVKNNDTGNVVRSIAGADDYSLWISSANFNRVLGIGIRTTDLMDLQQSSIGVNDVPSKFKDSCFIVTDETITGFAFQTSNDIWNAHPRSKSGLLNTKAMAYCETYTYPLSQAYFGLQGPNAKTKKFGQYTLQGFMCSPSQSRAIYASQSVLKIVGNIFNLTKITNFTYSAFGASYDYGYSNNNNVMWTLADGSGPSYAAGMLKSRTNYVHLVIYPF